MAMMIGGAANDDGNADAEPEHQHGELTVRGRSHGDHVVEAHDNIGNGDDRHGAQHAVVRGRLAETIGCIVLGQAPAISTKSRTAPRRPRS